MPPGPNDCGPLDVLAEASFLAALGEPPLRIFKLAGPLGIVMVIVALAAIVIAHRSDLQRVLRRLVICAAAELLLGGAAMWFGASSAAEGIRRLRTPGLRDVVAGANPALAVGDLGIAFALFVLAQLLVVHLRRGAEGGGSRRAPLLVSIGLAVAFGGALVLLDARARERIEREVREKEARWRARGTRIGLALMDAEEGRDTAFGRALKLDRDDHPEAALEAYDEALAKDPRDADALCFRGILKDKLGDTPGAVADLRAALAIDPGNDYARAFLSHMDPWKPRR